MFKHGLRIEQGLILAQEVLCHLSVQNPNGVSTASLPCLCTHIIIFPSISSEMLCEKGTFLHSAIHWISHTVTFTSSSFVREQTSTEQNRAHKHTGLRLAYSIT